MTARTIPRTIRRETGRRMAFDTGSFPSNPTEQEPAGATEAPVSSHAPSGPVPGAMMEIVRPPAYGRGIFVTVASAAAVFGLAVAASGETPTATGVPMTETTSPLFWGVAVIVAVLVGIGAQYSEFTAARAAESLGAPRRRSELPTAWCVPFVAEVAAI